MPPTDQVLIFQAYFASNLFPHGFGHSPAIERCHFAERDREVAPGCGWLREKVLR